MHYSPEQIAEFTKGFEKVQAELDQLLLQAVRVGSAQADERAKEQLLHGAGRRIRLIRRCLANIFRRFPLTRERPIPADDLDEVQISLHAYVLNLHGYFDNLAWAFVYRHGLEASIGKRTNVGMFLAATQRHLPSNIKNYLTSSTIQTWHTQYLKTFRDALAHRVPLYVPPAVFRKSEAEQFASLEKAKVHALTMHDLEEYEHHQEAQAALGSACPMFTQSYTDDGKPRHVYLHPQLLCDSMAIIEFSKLFFAHWHAHA